VYRFNTVAIFNRIKTQQWDGIDTEEAEGQCSKRRHPNPSSGCYRKPLSGLVVAEHDQRELSKLFDSFPQIPK
jgi:hypothetical protein